MFILVWKMRQSIEFQKSRSLVQALMSQQGAQDESIKKAFDDLKEAFFPFDKNQRSVELKKMNEALMKELKRGPLVIDVVEDPMAKRKMAPKLARGQKDLANRLSMERSGQMTGIDAIQRAQRRPRGAS